MIKSTRTVRLLIGVIFIVLGIYLWTLDDSSTVGQGSWFRNWHYFVPGFISLWIGGWYIYRTVISRKKEN